MALPLAAPAPAPDREELGVFVSHVCDVVGAALPGADSIIWKGSAYKAWEGPYDFLPGLSDLDVHVYRAGGLGDGWRLRGILADRVGPAPGEIPFQLLVLDPAELPGWWTVLPGTYRVMAGGPPPCPAPVRSVLTDRDRIGLAEATGHAARVGAGVVARPDRDLWAYLVSLRWMFGPVLHRVVSLACGEPERVWALNRTRVLDLAGEIPDVAPVRDAALAYLDAALAAGLSRPDPAPTIRALQAGEALLRVAGEWAATRPGALPERRAPGWWREA